MPNMTDQELKNVKHSEYTRGFHAGKERQAAQMKQAELIIKSFQKSLNDFTREIENSVISKLVKSKSYSKETSEEVLKIAEDVASEVYDKIHSFAQGDF